MPRILLYLIGLLFLFLSFLIPMNTYNFLRYLYRNKKNCKFTLIFSLKHPDITLIDLLRSLQYSNPLLHSLLSIIYIYSALSYLLLKYPTVNLENYPILPSLIPLAMFLAKLTANFQDKGKKIIYSMKKRYHNKQCPNIMFYSVGLSFFPTNYEKYVPDQFKNTIKFCNQNNLNGINFQQHVHIQQVHQSLNSYQAPLSANKEALTESTQGVIAAIMQQYKILEIEVNRLLKNNASSKTLIPIKNEIEHQQSKLHEIETVPMDQQNLLIPHFYKDIHQLNLNINNLFSKQLNVFDVILQKIQTNQNQEEKSMFISSRFLMGIYNNYNKTNKKNIRQRRCHNRFWHV